MSNQPKIEGPRGVQKRNITFEEFAFFSAPLAHHKLPKVTTPDIKKYSHAEPKNERLAQIRSILDAHKLDGTQQDPSQDIIDTNAETGESAEEKPDVVAFEGGQVTAVPKGPVVPAVVTQAPDIKPAAPELAVAETLREAEVPVVETGEPIVGAVAQSETGAKVTEAEVDEADVPIVQTLEKQPAVAREEAVLAEGETESPAETVAEGDQPAGTQVETPHKTHKQAIGGAGDINTAQAEQIEEIFDPLKGEIEIEVIE